VGELLSSGCSTLAAQLWLLNSGCSTLAAGGQRDEKPAIKLDKLSGSRTAESGIMMIVLIVLADEAMPE
jgi:hypothetical protein